MNLLLPTYKILYNNKNITADISDHLISLTYTDKVSGEADEFEMVLEDADGLWRNEWYPDKGATLNAEIEQDGSVLPCGEFDIDEPAFGMSRSSGDTVSIKGIAASFTKSLRTKRHTAHENKTLREIAKTVADRHGLTLQGEIPSIPISRQTQHNKNDLEFLQKLATDYGLVFSVRGKKMIFTDLVTLETSGSVLSLKKSECNDIAITDKSSQTFKNAKIQYHNPDDKTLVEYETQEVTITVPAKPLILAPKPQASIYSPLLPSFYTPGNDTKVIRRKVENKQQADRMAKTALYRASSFQREGTVTIPGNPKMISGVNFSLTGIGKLSGIYHIIQSAHTLTRGDSYTTSCDIKQVGSVSEALYK